MAAYKRVSLIAYCVDLPNDRPRLKLRNCLRKAFWSDFSDLGMFMRIAVACAVLESCGKARSLTDIAQEA